MGGGAQQGGAAGSRVGRVEPKEAVALDCGEERFDSNESK